MKIAIIMTLAVSGTSAFAGPLAGSYKVQSNACSSLYPIGSTIEIHADSSSLSYGPEVIFEGQTGYASQLDARVGTFKSAPGPVSDGTTVVESGAYSSDENEFSFTMTESERQTPLKPTVERTVTIKKNGGIVTLQDSSGDIAGPACVLVD